MCKCFQPTAQRSAAMPMRHASPPSLLQEGAVEVGFIPSPVSRDVVSAA